jgi:hypothetical protein
MLQDSLFVEGAKFAVFRACVLRVKDAPFSTDKDKTWRRVPHPLKAFLGSKVTLHYLEEIVLE